jgi:hypothetical protein
MGFNKAFEDRKFMIFYVRKLRYLYKTFELGDNPIGLNPISSNSKNIKNYDVSYTVKGHFEYKKNLQTILKKLEL